MDMDAGKTPTDIQDYEPDAEAEPNELFTHKRSADFRQCRPTPSSSRNGFMRHDEWLTAVLSHPADMKVVYAVKQLIQNEINRLNKNTQRPPLSLAQCEEIQCKPIITALDDVIYRKARGLLIFLTPNFAGDKGYCGIRDSIYRCSLDLKFPIIIIQHGFTDVSQNPEMLGMVYKNVPPLVFENQEYFFSSLNDRIYSYCRPLTTNPKTSQIYLKYQEAPATKKKQTVEQKKYALQSAAELSLPNSLLREQEAGIEETLTDKNKLLPLATAVVEDGSKEQDRDVTTDPVSSIPTENANKTHTSTGETFASNASSVPLLSATAMAAKKETGNSVEDLENSGRESPTESDSAFASGSSCGEPLAETEQLNNDHTLERGKRTGTATMPTNVGESENPPGQNDEKDSNDTCEVMPKGKNCINADGNQSSVFADQGKMGKNAFSDQSKPFTISEKNQSGPNETLSQWTKNENTAENEQPKQVANFSHDTHPIQLGLTSFVSPDASFLPSWRNNSSLNRIQNQCKTLASSSDNIAKTGVPSEAGRNKNKNCSWPILSLSKHEASACDDDNIKDEDLFGYGTTRKESANHRGKCSTGQSFRDDFDGASHADKRNAELTDQEPTKKSQNDTDRHSSRRARNASVVNVNTKCTMNLPASVSINDKKSISHKTLDIKASGMLCSDKERKTDKENKSQGKENCLKYDLKQQQSLKRASDLKLREELRAKEPPSRQEDEKSPGHDVTPTPNSAAGAQTNSASAASSAQINPDAEKSVSDSKSPIFLQSELTAVKVPFSIEETTQASEGTYIDNAKMHQHQPVGNTTKNSPVISDDCRKVAEKKEEKKQVNVLSTGDRISDATLSRQAAQSGARQNLPNIVNDLDEDAEKIEEKEQVTAISTGDRLCDTKISRFQAVVNDARQGPSSSKDLNSQDIEKRVEQKQFIGLSTGKMSREKVLAAGNECEALASETHARAPTSGIDNEIPDKRRHFTTPKAADSWSPGNALEQHFLKDGHAKTTDRSNSKQQPQDHLDSNTNFFENGFANSALSPEEEKHKYDFEGLKGPASLGLMPRHNWGVEDSTIDLRQHRMPFKTPVQARQPVEEMMNRAVTFPSQRADEFKMAAEATREHSKHALHNLPMNPNTIHININFAQTENCAIVVGDGPTRRGPKLAIDSEANARETSTSQQLPLRNLTTDDPRETFERQKPQKKKKRKKMAVK